MLSHGFAARQRNAQRSATVPVLRTLRIRDLAILDDVTVEFGDGLNVLTGETGAGKSILVDALGLVAGARGDRTRIRAGCERAIVEALFEIEPEGDAARLLVERGLAEIGTREIVVRRELQVSGGRIWLSGSPSTLALLSEIGPTLVELHGQHEFRTLLAPERQLAILDRFADARKAEEVAAAHAAVLSARRAVRELAEAAARRAERTAELETLVHEVDLAQLRPGELEDLDRERRILRNASTVTRLLDELVERIEDGEPSAAALAAQAARRAHELQATDGAVRELAERLDAAAIELQDLGSAFRSYRERMEFHPDRIDAVESRHATLSRLLVRHGATEPELLERRGRAASEIEALARVGDELRAAEAESGRVEARYAQAALALREARRRAAERLARAIERQLKDLALPKARFAVGLDEPLGGEAVVVDGASLPLTARGADRAELQLAANPGEPLGALSRVASGGELSRVLLALHAAAEASASGSRVLVFDEVDAGVGGAVADAVGARLRRLAARNQVLCVTHLPQVAAYADRHFAVGKRVVGGRTLASVTPLDEARSVDELARMVGGREATEVSRRHAAELVLAARRLDGGAP
jgi:DNA repair protein RecN (Recombination protein N)